MKDYIYLNVSWVIEFLTWWVLESKVFGQKINCSQLKLLGFFNWLNGKAHKVELVSKELNHLAAILHVYAGGLNFMK